MTFELILLAGLIIVFIVSFCGLLQKIRQSYEDERLASERAGRNQDNDTGSLSEIYINPAYSNDNLQQDNSVNSDGVYPSAPPPYIEIYCDPPPKYEDIIKSADGMNITTTTTEERR